MAFGGGGLTRGVACSGSGMIRWVAFGGHVLIMEGLYWKWPYKRGNTVIRSEINIHFIYISQIKENSTQHDS